MSRIDEHFHEYFAALDRSGQEDRCFLCRRTPAEVKRFFGFDEDGVAIEAARHGLEDIVLDASDIMSYRGERPVCAVCQLNVDAIQLLGEDQVVQRLYAQMAQRRAELWPDGPPAS
ncbi:MAG: hypothetical protein JNK02_00500 [Planctomycetes bacterium]|nr:hypothetical protein [Planctomycetota bacterium]